MSLAIMLLCAVCFAASWVLPANPEGASREQLGEAFTYWQQHPYLEFSEEFAQRFFNRKAADSIEQLRAGWLAENAPPEALVVRTEQSHFDELLQGLVDARVHTALYRWSLVPSRGLAQRGWVTSMFVHFGWLHLIFNMLFLYLVGLMLEDLWGPLLYAGFYLVGGLVAAGCHYALDPHSNTLMGGASGAIAACMGAFAVRFASKKVSFFYFVMLGFRPRMGTTSVSAWVAGLAWFGHELYSFVMGDAQGVAVAAHVGGFAFGSAVAFGMKLGGLDRRFAATSEQDTGPLVASIHPEVESGRVAFSQGRYPDARAHFVKALKLDATDFDAEWELVKLDLAEQHLEPALRRLERTLSGLLRERRDEQATSALVSVWQGLDLQALSPRFCWQMARALETSNPDFAEPLYARAGADATLVGGKALVRAAELRLHGTEARWLARGYLEAARAKGFAELRARVDELWPRCPEAPAPVEASGLELDVRAAVSTQGQRPRVLEVSISSVNTAGLEAAGASGQRRSVGFAQVVGLAAALVPLEQPGQAKKGRLVVDLVMAWATAHGPTTVLRFDSDQSGPELSRHFGTGGTARELYGRFFAHVLQASNARAVPDAVTLTGGQFPRFESISAFEVATYGAAR